MDSLSFLVDGWLELESDPGLFTLLVQDFGCKGVQVEEIYDLTKVGLIDGHVYGFIFLFKWIEERRSRQRQMFINFQSTNKKKNETKTEPSIEQPCYVEDENLVNSMFFAHQIIPNSCATHAILSVLLNCQSIHLGKTLTRLKEITHCMDPESKGMAIGNMPELAKVHNLHVSYYDRNEMNNRQTSSKANVFPRATTSDSFHFISFVSINNRVYELDGLKKYPIDHGPIQNNETFSEKFRRIILERIPQQQYKENKLNLQLRKLQTDMNLNTTSDIRYSLMAVVPDRKLANLKKVKLLKLKREILLQVLQKLTTPIRLSDPLEFHNYSKYSPVVNCNQKIEINVNRFIINDHNLNNSCQNLKINSQNSQQNLNNNEKDEIEETDEGNSTDTCSESDLIDFHDNLIEENEQLDNLYAFKFVSLNEQENKVVNQNSDLDTNLQESSDKKNKRLSKNELIDFYKNYALKDIINILNQFEQEISNCNKNIQEENEKRTKFHIDDSRRTHNYNDFITTYLLMLTEQKKLHSFLDKNNKQVNLSPKHDFNKNEKIPFEFFKEIVKNYGDVVLNEDLDKTNLNQITQNTSQNFFKRKRTKRNFTCKTDKLNLIES